MELSFQWACSNENEPTGCVLFDGSLFSPQDTPVLSFDQFALRAGTYPNSFSSSLDFTVLLISLLK
jgi:hypothetical protein